MKNLSTLIIVTIALIIYSCNSQNKKAQNTHTNTFTVNQPDYEISPYTGMTRQHWKDAALYLLQGAFSHINDIDDAMVFPKQPGKTYPHRPEEIPTEKLEGLCRTLFVAAPLLREDSALIVNNIKVADYYRQQIVNLIDSSSNTYINPRAKNGGPNQNLVEFGALAISLFTIPDVIWDPLTQIQKDKLAHVMLSYGDGPTVPSNWKFFNIFVLSFFKDQGYSVNEALLEEYLQKSLDDYRGEGWYNDNPAYDYYSMWAYQLYGTVWSYVFGNKYYPEYAKKFQNHYNDMAINYPHLFSADGKMIMWGRSISYRMASISTLPFVGLSNETNANLGWLRKIGSSTILQFLQHPDFLKDSVPTLGFYGAFEPAVQNYSCRGSVYWMGKAFLGLLIPEDNAFWTSKENNGPWEKEYTRDTIYNYYSPATNVMITNYPNSGASEIRAWCHEKVADDWQKFRSSENYNRLSYHSALPWQADGTNGEVAMNYTFKTDSNTWEVFRLYTFQKFANDIYYRDAVLETNANIKMQLAEMSLPNGILRVDKNISSENIAMKLGHYALPKIDRRIKTTTRNIANYKATIIDNGRYQTAFIPLTGWNDVEVIKCANLHPEADSSYVINASAFYKPSSEQIYSCLMLWKKSGETWSDQELMPINNIRYNNDSSIVEIQFNNGVQKKFSFNKQLPN